MRHETSDRRTPDSLSRRTFVRGLGVAAGAAVGGLPPRRAAADGKMVVGTWGGDYAKLLTQNVETPILKPKGIEVVQDIAGDSQRRAKLVAEKRLPRGTTDLQALSAAGSYEMWQAGVLEELDYAKIPNSKHLLAPMKTQYSVGHIYSGKVVLYNPAMISPAPTSFNDLWDPKHPGKVGVIDIQYVFTLRAAALVGGGTMENFEPAKAKLLDLKKMGVKMYPTNEAMAQALKTGEVGICIMWKARGVMWQNAGVPDPDGRAQGGRHRSTSPTSSCRRTPRTRPPRTRTWTRCSSPPRRSRSRRPWATTRPCTTPSCPTPSPSASASRKEEQARLLTPNYDYIAKNDCGLEGMVGQDLQGMSLAGEASCRPTGRRPPPSGAPRLPWPSSSSSASWCRSRILFRYSLNRFVPGSLMVEALTVENYVKFVTDPFYIAVPGPDPPRRRGVHGALPAWLAFPSPTRSPGPASRWKSVLIMLVVLPLFVGNAVRAAGWMVMFGSKGVVNTVLGALGLIDRPIQLMYTETAVIIGITAVNLPFMVLTLQSGHRGHRPRARGGGPEPRRAAPRTFRRVILAARDAGHPGRHDPHVHPRDERVRDARCSSAGPRFQMMGPVVYGQFAGLNNWPFGAALAFVLMTATLVLTVASNVLVQRRYRR